jgi:hypothetical protein
MLKSWLCIYNYSESKYDKLSKHQQGGVALEQIKFAQVPNDVAVFSPWAFKYKNYALYMSTHYTDSAEPK